MTTFLCLTDPEPACYLLLARCEAGEIVCFEASLATAATADVSTALLRHSADERSDCF
jgi:hypothetical protein